MNFYSDEDSDEYSYVTENLAENSMNSDTDDRQFIMARALYEPISAHSTIESDSDINQPDPTIEDSEIKIVSVQGNVNPYRQEFRVYNPPQNEEDIEGLSDTSEPEIQCSEFNVNLNEYFVPEIREQNAENGSSDNDIAINDQLLMSKEKPSASTSNIPTTSDSFKIIVNEDAIEVKFCMDLKNFESQLESLILTNDGAKYKQISQKIGKLYTQYVKYCNHKSSSEKFASDNFLIRSLLNPITLKNGVPAEYRFIEKDLNVILNDSLNSIKCKSNMKWYRTPTFPYFCSTVQEIVSKRDIYITKKKIRDISKTLYFHLIGELHKRRIRDSIFDLEKIEDPANENPALRRALELNKRKHTTNSQPNTSDIVVKKRPKLIPVLDIEDD